MAELASSKQKTHPTPWRIEHLNVPLADTGDYDDLTKILAADGDEVAHWWNADDVEETLAERIVQAANAVETPVNALGSKLMMELFNFMPIEALAEVPADIAERLSNFMVANGYRIVFDRWYLQAEPREPARSAPKTSVVRELCPKCKGHQSTHDDTRACKICGGSGFAVSESPNHG